MCIEIYPRLIFYKKKYLHLHQLFGHLFISCDVGCFVIWTLEVLLLYTFISFLSFSWLVVSYTGRRKEEL